MHIAHRRQPGELADQKTLKLIQSEQVTLTDDQIAAVLEKHRLGAPRSSELVGAHFLNVVYAITPATGEALILKVQLREGLGSLRAEDYMIRLLGSSTDLPVSSYSMLDGDRDVLAYPYLLVARLPGENCRTLFERASHATRLQLSGELGRILRVIHGQDVDDPKCLPNDDLNEWRSIFQATFFGDDCFRQEIVALSPSFLPQLTKAMAAIAPASCTGPPVLLWRDPGLSNMLAQESASGVTVSGLFDFQFSSFGSPFIDRTIAENGFWQSTPSEARATEEYLAAFREGYGARETEGREDRDVLGTLFAVLTQARAARLWWDWARILHTETPDRLEKVLIGLQRLA
jgi:Ser/Thr protein kinase RdoA (MazF antagonist)